MFGRRRDHAAAGRGLRAIHDAVYFTFRGAGAVQIDAELRQGCGGQEGDETGDQIDQSLQLTLPRPAFVSSDASMLPKPRSDKVSAARH